MGSYHSPQPLGMGREPVFSLTVRKTVELPTEFEGTPHGTFAATGAHQATGLTEEDLDLIVDVTQFALDIGGIVEPTPFCDIGSGLISVHKGDWFEVGISAISLVPYIGDLAKIGKLKRYTKLIAKVADRAAKSPAFAAKVRPMLTRTRQALDMAPDSDALRAIKHQLDNALDAGGHAAAKSSAKALDAAFAGLKPDVAKRAAEVWNTAPKKNVRLLSRKPAGIKEAEFVRELEQKGFKLVKEGSSTVYMRRVPGGKVEAIRIDKPNARTPATNPKTIAKNQRKQAENAADYAKGKRPHLRDHNHAAEVTKDGRTISTSAADRVNNAAAGNKVDTQPHWHHETFDASPKSMKNYLEANEAGVSNLTKLDFSGKRVEPIRDVVK